MKKPTIRIIFEYTNEFREKMTLVKSEDGKLLFQHEDIVEDFVPLKTALKKYILNEGEQEAIKKFLALVL